MRSRRIFSMVLAIALVFCLSAGAVAATPGVLYDVDEKNFISVLKENGNNGLILLDKKPITYEALGKLGVQQGSELKIYLTANMFVDNQGTKISTKATHVSRTQIRQANITLRRSTSSGSSVFKTLGITNDKVGTYIVLKFVDEFVSVKDQDFSAALSLMVGSKTRPGTQFTVVGTMEVDLIEVYRGDDYVDLSDGRVALAEERVTNIMVDLGSNVLVTANLTKGYKYYGTCNNNISTADFNAMNKYSSIVDVLTLKTINMKNSTKSVLIDLTDKLYVYNYAGKYVGTTGQELPYSTKYYLSTRKYDSLAL